MSNIGNKETMSKNLKYYIEKSGKDRKELAEIWGFPYSTVTEWINAKKYPRIDRIEIMANYFGIMKSDLIEDKKEVLVNSDIVSDIVVKLRTDEDFLSVVEVLYSIDLDNDKASWIKQMLTPLRNG